MTGNITDISDKVKYIGVNDYAIDLFESQYAVPEGITYNSYLLKGEKIAVIDTTDSNTGADWLCNLKQALGGKTPDYLIIEHLEPDHSSLISTFAELYPDAKLVMSATALRMLPEYLSPMPAAERIITAGDGDTIDLGGISLKFILAPMVHWPEVMMAYCPEEKILFSADAFGTFGATEEPGEDWALEARRYYYNIVGKYGPQVQKLLKKANGLDIRAICPLHGPVLAEDISHYVALYDKWSRYEPETDGIFIACASIHGNTMQAAAYLAECLRKEGIRNVYVADLTRDDRSEALAIAFTFPAAVFCASSYDSGLFTPMYSFMHTLAIKGYCNRKAAIVENGSWAPSAGKVMCETLGKMKGIDIMPETLTLRGVFKESDKTKTEKFAGKIAEAFRR